MKGKAGRPRVPLSNISNRKADGLTGSPAPTPSGEGDAQLARGGGAKKRAQIASGKVVKKRMDKKVRRADGGSVSDQQKQLDTSYYNKLQSLKGLSQSDRNRMQTQEGRDNATKGNIPPNIGDSEPDMEPQGKKSGGGIHIKPSHKGLLHKDTKTAKGEKIPEAKIKKAENSSNPATRKRAVFAENAKHWKKK